MLSLSSRAALEMRLLRQVFHSYLEDLGGQAHGALDAQVLGLGALEQLGADLLERLHLARGEGDADLVDLRAIAEVAFLGLLERHVDGRSVGFEMGEVLLKSCRRRQTRPELLWFGKVMKGCGVWRRGATVRSIDRFLREGAQIRCQDFDGPEGARPDVAAGAVTVHGPTVVPSRQDQTLSPFLCVTTLILESSSSDN